MSIKLKVTDIFIKNLHDILFPPSWNSGKGGGGWKYENSTLKIGCYKLIHGESEHIVKLYINDFTEGNKFYGINGMC